MTAQGDRRDEAEAAIFAATSVAVGNLLDLVRTRARTLTAAANEQEVLLGIEEFWRDESTEHLIPAVLAALTREAERLGVTLSEETILAYAREVEGYVVTGRAVDGATIAQAVRERFLGITDLAAQQGWDDERLQEELDYGLTMPFTAVAVAGGYIALEHRQAAARYAGDIERYLGKLGVTTGEPGAIARLLRTDPTFADLYRLFRRASRNAVDIIAILTEEFGPWERRARRIARTEAAAAVNTGRSLSEKLRGRESKSWRTRGDSKVRPAHAAVDAACRAPNEDFNVDGYPMDSPGDRSRGAPAHLIANCRCELEWSRRPC